MIWTGTIRLSTEEDISFIVTCEKYDYLNSWPSETHRKNLNDPNFIYLSGLNENGTLAGYSLLVRTDANNIEYKRIATKTPNKGFGKPYMKAVLDYLGAQTDYKKVWLDVYEANERARHVYKKLGFIETGITEPPKTSPSEFGKLVVMEKTI